MGRHSQKGIVGQTDMKTWGALWRKCEFRCEVRVHGTMA